MIFSILKTKTRLITIFTRRIFSVRMTINVIHFPREKKLPHKWDYYLRKFELKEKFDKELKAIFNSTDNTSNIKTQLFIITELNKSF